MEVREGSIVRSPFWPEPVKVEKVAKIGENIRIIGSTINSNQYIDAVLSEKEVEKIEVFVYKTDFSAGSEDVFLALEGYRFKLASLFDPLLAMNVSRVDPLPHQIDAVYDFVLKHPKIRFLIADDPGAGKTIMAGLVIKELKLRGLVKRLLIVVPGHLKDQWRRELKDKFTESFIVVDRGMIDSHYGENIWERENQIITSIDFAKQDTILPSIESVNWDLVIVDEAHKMAAYRFGDKLEKTARYKLGETLSRNSDHLLTLTATPHKGDPENFRLFLDLLEPGFFSSAEMVRESIKNKDNPLFIRRLKEDLKDFDGKPLFMPRHVTTIKFSITNEEIELYNKLSNYVITQYNKALRSDKKRNIAFALLILQRRMASSVYAVKRSLERRKKRLIDILHGEKEKPIKQYEIDEEVDDYDESQRWEVEEGWETLSVAENVDELNREIATIEQLIERCDEIIKREDEVKLSELRKLMEKEAIQQQKILIFTESRDTLEYLVEKIHTWGYNVIFIHGGMKLEDRIKAEHVFKHEAQIMVATEAAGEGINLQFCNIMINYDIPWNPNRLEQRMGRIHRYGQVKEVFVYNLVAKDTREGQVLSRILDKLEEIRTVLGSDKVFDVVGEVFYGKRLYQFVLEAAANARDVSEIEKEIDVEVDEEYILRVKEALGESLATRFIDYTHIKEMAEKAKEYRLIPEYTESFFVRAFEKAGGKVTKHEQFFRVDSIPYEIRRIAEEISFKNMWGMLGRKYAKIIFDKDVAKKYPEAEFVSFGHPLFEVILEWVLRNYKENALRGSVFKDPSGIYNGTIWFCEGEVKDGKGVVAGKKLFAMFDDGNLREINPSLIWDLAPHSGSYEFDEGRKSEAENYAINALNNFKSELLKERERQAGIKEKYGIKSLNALISEYDGKLMRYYQRADKGEKMDLAIQNAKRKKEDYQRALEELKIEIEREKHLSISMPRFVGVIKVIAGDEMVSDEEIEKIGMDVAMAYERQNGRVPEDVSAEKLGYDIRSRDGEVRYIEVKARAATGDVALTPNEWFKARRFEEQYWLYVVENAAINPVLYIINNPAEKLKVVEKVEAVRFVVPAEEWKWKGRMEKV